MRDTEKRNIALEPANSHDAIGKLALANSRQTEFGSADCCILKFLYTNAQRLFSKLEELRIQISSRPDVVLMCDFNAPSIRWNYLQAQSFDHRLLKTKREALFTQHVFVPTRARGGQQARHLPKLLGANSVEALFGSESCAGLHAEGNIAGSADLNRLISQLTANSRSPTYLLVQDTGSITLNGAVLHQASV
ncbi:unnamed protein product [Schistocephalus solidus]|uniref:Endo/exonuclease/phosphatase domain-containing protein n=1 Tax=Schistocephalus solidus TaxID=70667 RepID=A0A183TLP8_SCHSO|nr:unnamed protein product [Schistocephalus solidus]